MTKFYAGIGSRSTPKDIQHLMSEIAAKLSLDGWVLRSGHADGADLAFELGANDEAEIYLPWSRFNAHYPVHGKSFAAPTQEAMKLAMGYHPAWDKCTNGGKLLHARNMHQILGKDLHSPVRFVICWTKDGQDSGGTGQALRVARERNIPIFNLFHEEHRMRLERFVSPDSGVPVSVS